MIEAQHDILAILTEAVRLESPEERSRYLDDACGSDAIARRKVETLLRAHLDAGNFLGKYSPDATATGNSECAEKPGAQIGPYKLLEQIGEGGFGVVYMAEQTEPVRRKVALKVLKPGMDTRQVVARFEAERQALALMDHPNIAKIFDAGMVGEGREQGTGNREQGERNEKTPLSPVPCSLSPLAVRPYFVMELVRGVPITEYCDQNHLTPRERLELFVTVCHAVQHAHQKGLIHRDLKPSNVLVSRHDTTPIVKIIDFGVAKALGQSLTDKTLFTGLAQMIGTPLYMSPEQAGMSDLDVDTRSDIYSLGVLLYELLTGTTPFDKERLKSVGFDEMRRIIREEEPETVSARIAKTRRVGSAHQTPLPRGEGGRRPGEGVQQSTPSTPSATSHQSLATRRSELDWIVMKALEKDRSRRYESASALAADIQRYLSDEPVLACPPTTMYRFQKFARKHRSALVTAAAVALCLILGTTVSAWQAVRATAAEGQAAANEAQAKEAAAAEAQQRKRAEANEQKAATERDEVKSLNEKLQASQANLRRTLYAAHMNLAKNAWDEATVPRVQTLLGKHRPQPGEVNLRDFEWHYLNRLCNSQLLTLHGHTDKINSIAFSPDGKRLATASKDRTVKVWDAQTGAAILTITGHAAGRTSGVLRVAFGADGKRLASVTSREMKVWDAQSGQELVSIDGRFDTLAYSRDGKFLASGEYSGEQGNRKHEVKLWDAETGKVHLTLSGELSSLNAIDFSPDSKSLVAAEWDSILKIWDVATGKELLSLKGSEWSSVAFSEDGKRLATGGFKVQIWDLQTGQEIHSFNKGWSDSVAFSPDGKQITTCDEELIIWDSETGKAIRTLKGAGSGAIYSPDGQRLASAADNVVKVWDVNQDQESASITIENPDSAAFSPDWRLIADADSDDTVRIRDVASGQQLLRLKGHTVPLRRLAFSRDGKLLASGGGGQRWPGGGLSIGSKTRAEIKVWDTQTGRELFTLPPLVGSVQSMSFSPDGKRLASAAAAPNNPRPGEVVGEIKLWDAKTGTEFLTIKGHSGFVQSIAFSPDGTRLASYGGAEVKLWDSQTGQEMLSLASTAGSGKVAFSPDGKRLACNAGSSAQVWDSQTGKVVIELYKGNSSYRSNLVFSPDGKRLAGAANNKTIKIWDAQTGEETLTLKGQDTVATVEFSLDSHRLASACLDGTVKIYDATPLPEKP